MGITNRRYRALLLRALQMLGAEMHQVRSQVRFFGQRLVGADARTQEVAQGFLGAASAAATEAAIDSVAQVTLYPPVPMTIQRVANIERAQMLVESPSRAALQRFLSAWHGTLHSTRQRPEHKGLIRWAVDVDPLVI
mgnify:CR=1 FL=1